MSARTLRNEEGFSERLINFSPKDLPLQQDWLKVAQLRFVGTKALCPEKVEFSQV